MMTFLVMVMMTTTIMMMATAMVMARRITCTRLRMVMLMIVNFGDKNCCRTSGEGAAKV